MQPTVPLVGAHRQRLRWRPALVRTGSSENYVPPLEQVNLCRQVMMQCRSWLKTQQDIILNPSLLLTQSANLLNLEQITKI